MATAAMSCMQVWARGRLTRDPDTVTFNDGPRAGTKMVFAALAVPIPERKRNDEHTVWLRCIGFGAVGRALSTHREGESVAVGGDLGYNTFVGRDGKKREQWECRIESLASHLTVFERASKRSTGEDAPRIDDVYMDDQEDAPPPPPMDDAEADEADRLLSERYSSLR